VGGSHEGDSRETQILLTAQCDGEASDGHLDTAGRVPGTHRHKGLQLRLGRSFSGQTHISALAWNDDHTRN
jgi:hypothetical protein